MDVKKKISIAVVGNPNCGKTTLFNGLTGGKQHIGNWPGVTVEKKEGKVSYKDSQINIIDLPGIYSLSAYTEDEKVARNYLLSGDSDIVLNVIDATNFERNLYLTTQLIEMKVPLIIVLNMIDLAKKHNIIINSDLLSKKFGVKVIEISAIEKKDIDMIKDQIINNYHKIKKPKSQIDYPDEIEDLIKKWSGKVSKIAKKIGVNERYIIIKLLEDDLKIKTEILKNKNLLNEEIENEIKKVENILGDSCDIILADYKYGFIHSISKEIIKRKSSKIDITDKIDKILLHKVLGIPIFLAVMYLVFWLTMNLGSSFIDFFDILFGTVFVDGFGAVLSKINTPGWIIAILANGIGTGLQTISTFIPIIFMLFLVLSVLEDSGYMARAAFIMDKYMRIIGLPGKSFVSLLVGFGCTVPSVMATRTLENKRDRYLTVFMSPLMSCSARFPVYFIFASAFFPKSTWNIVFSIYLAGIALAVLNGLLLKNTLFRGETSHFIMELPPYHLPRPKHIMLHTWTKLKQFIFKAGKIIIFAVAIFGFLNTISFTGKIGDYKNSILSKTGKFLSPVFKPMGIEKENWPASVALISGLFAKESVIGTLNGLYHQLESADTDNDEDFDFISGIKNAFISIPINLSRVFGVGFLFSTEIEDKDLFTYMNKYFAKGKLQVYAYMLFILIYFPCIAALGAIIKEIGFRIGIFLVSYLTVLAWIVSTLFYQIFVGHNIIWIIIPLAILAFIIILFYILGKINIFKFEKRNI